MSNTARRTAITYPDGRVVNLGYGASGSIEDAFGLVKTIGIEGESGDKVDYTRVGLGRFVTIAYPEPDVEMSMIRPGGGSEGDSGDPYDGFDRFNRVQQMRWQGTATGTPIDAWKWGFNEGSNRTWKKNLVAASGQDEAYVYDGLSQVIRDAVGTLNTNRTAIGGIPGEEADFTYDPTGNWLAYRKNEDGSPVLEQSRSNNKDNQLTKIDGSSQGIEFDRAGNSTKLRPGAEVDWSKHFIAVWDAWNRLVEVKAENGATVQKNTYDGLSRRITKESGGKVVHTYWSDRWKPLEERVDSATAAARQYLWGERPSHRDELILRDRDTDGDGTLDERLYATMDYFNGTAVLDTSGTVVERHAYAAFGPRRVMAADFTSRSSSLYDWDFGFQGQFRDAETGWYNYGYRFYVPELGRWINRDPIGEEGGENVYKFVENNSLAGIDYLGLDIRLERGNDTTWQILNNIFHMQVCVDQWELSDPNCTDENKWDNECNCHIGIECFSFARTGIQAPQFSQSWLGWSSPVGGAILRGEVYTTAPVADAAVHDTHVTTMEQDENWYNYMVSVRVGLIDAYSVARHNCVKYSRMEFDDAPLHW